MADQDVDLVLDEVRAWRFVAFRELGCTDTEAELLAESDAADLGVARKMIRDGCPPSMLVRILG